MSNVELFRLIHNLIRLGTIAEVDHARARVRVKSGELLTDWLLAGDLGSAFDAIDRHAEIELPPTRRAALASFVYNVGEGAFAGSTLLRKLNAGDIRGACNELPRWVYAKGRKLAGLVKRRATERELCLTGLEAETTMASASQGSRP